MNRPDYEAMLATPDEQRDGKGYLTGFRIRGQHCGNCGRPDNTRPILHDSGLLESATTPCCGTLPCSGYVVTKAWQARSNPDRAVWACCRGLADRRLGEPTWLNLDAQDRRP
jgi:hypothetical protein